MGAERPEQPARRQGTLHKLGALSSSVLRMAQTRLELAGLELALERDSLFAELQIAALGITAAGLAGFAAILLAALALPPAYRLWVLGALTLGFAAFAAGAWVWLRSHRAGRTPLFARVARQLGRDRGVLAAALRRSTVPSP